ncbi:MAG TPA: hypothetical protein VIW29_17915 [Polyangiaceae bacterium]
MDNESLLLWTIVALVAVAIVIALAVVSHRRSRARRLALQRQFGPEYDRAVQELGPARAERELAARARRVEHFQFRDLSTADRGRFASGWSRIQLQFVDDPAVAVSGANELIKEVMRARGYPTEDFEQRAADLSVDHPAVVQHYRAAQALAASNRAGQASTEELRQAVVHYRVLFNDLLQPPSSMPAPLQHAVRHTA